MYSRNGGIRSSLTSLLDVAKTGPFPRRDLHALLVLFLQGEKLPPHGGYLADLGVHFCQSPLNEDLGVPAGTLAAVAHLEQFADIAEPQSHSLSAPDELKALDGGLVVEAIASRASLGRGQESKAVVVPQSVRSYPEAFGENGDRLGHKP